VTLYISGVIFSGMFEFHNDLVPGYDFTREMAKLGHTSVVIDRVGYGKTAPYPRDGRKVCLGSQADTVHQVIHALRDGSYSVLGSSSIRPQRFARVAVAGYSLGAVIAELEDASFTDVNALVELSWSDEGFSDYGTSPQYVLSHCSPGLPKPPDGRTGYFRTLPPRKVPPLLSPAVDPRIVATLAWNEELDPCGQELSGAAWFGGLAYVVRADIRIPVLILHGEYDVLFTGPAWHAQWTGFTGTRDRTLIGVPDGQMLMLDRHVGFTRRLLSAWLTDHRF
jgi:pimeloyl-ACP methyl ester carboxylesterase